MNRDNAPGRWKISDMASCIPEDALEAVEPAGDPALHPSAERIKELALQKRREHLSGNEDKPMKKKSFKVLLAVAMVGVLSVTALAAMDGFGYISSLFGGSAESIRGEVVTPYLSEAADGRELALEAVVTDGFVTNMVVSLTGRAPETRDLFTVTANTDTRSVGWYVMDQFSSAKKTYYAIDMTSAERFDAADVTISLDPAVAAIDLSFDITNNLGHTAVSFPESAANGSVTPRQLQVSPMGFLLTCMEEEARGGLPATEIELVFAGGRTETIEAVFDASDDTVSGGGGAILGGGSAGLPLVTFFQGTRNPDGELVVTGQFSRIIDASAIEAVLVDGVRYAVQ